MELHTSSPSNWQPLLCIVHGDYKEHCYLTKRWRKRFLDADFKDARALQFTYKAFSGTAGLLGYLEDCLVGEEVFSLLKQEKRALVLEFVFNGKDWQRGGKENLLPAFLSYWEQKVCEWTEADVYLQHCLIFLCFQYDRAKDQHIREYLEQHETPELDDLNLTALAERYDAHLPALVLPGLESISYGDAHRWAQKKEVTFRFGETIPMEVMRLYKTYKKEYRADVIPMLELSDELHKIWKNLSLEGT